MKLAERLTSEYLAGAQVPLALYIPLQRFTRHRDAHYFDDFIVGYLRSQYGMQDVAWVDVATWLTRRSAVILLDGFDEIAQLRTDLAVIDEFEHISTTLGPSCCSVLSCRTALAARFSDPLSTQLSSQLEEQGHRVPEVAVLEIFTSHEVEQYLDLAKAPRALLDGGCIARAVLRRPLFLKLAVETIDGEAAAHLAIKTEADLLERCIRQLLLRSNLRHAGIDTSQWRTFLENCALQMMLEDTTAVEPSRLTTMVKQHFRLGDEDIRKLQDAEFDARVRTVFDFDLGSNGLRWAHSIFRDYFACSAIALRLLEPQPHDTMLDGRALTPDQVAFIQFRIEQQRHRWKALPGFCRPAQEPTEISAGNPWKWISPGLGIIKNSDVAGAQLVFVRKGFWISAHPLSHDDVRSLGSYWTQRDLAEYRGRDVKPGAPLTNITHLDATRLATRLNARLPTENEWERAARWIDGSYPRADVIPRAETSRSHAPPVTGAAGNPWDVRNAAGCVWQWTATFDTGTQRYVCRGSWWGSTMEEKLTAGRLLPSEPSHSRTGLRIVNDPSNGGEL